MIPKTGPTIRVPPGIRVILLRATCRSQVLFSLRLCQYGYSLKVCFHIRIKQKNPNTFAEGTTRTWIVLDNPDVFNVKTKGLAREVCARD